MICDNCKINTATILWQQSINNETINVNLCDFCADKLNFDLYFSDFFKDFFDEIEKINFFNKINEELNIKKCNFCGNTLEKLKNTGKLGCSNCYLTFKEELNPIITKIQHNYQHIGKIPKRISPEIKLKIEIKDFKNKLKIAIKEENYELAAKIRDEIKELEKNIERRT